MRLATPVLVILLMAAGLARADDIVIIPDEHDEIERIIEAFRQPETKETARQIIELQTRLSLLKKRDFAALFGKPQPRTAKTHAMPLGQIRGYARPRVPDPDPASNKRRMDFHVIKDIGAFEIYYWIDGIRPEGILVYLPLDKDFSKLDKDNWKQRLAWDEARLKKLFAHVEARMLEVFPWEVDRAELAKMNGRSDFRANAADQLKAWIASGAGLKQTREVKAGRDAWLWVDADGLPVRSADGGEDKGPPSLFMIYYAKEKMFRHDSFLRASGELASRSWSTGKKIRDDEKGCWRWYGKDEKIIRLEWDDNHDGIPDWYLKAEDKPNHPSDEESNTKKRPLAINDSWAVNPKLIPEECQIPDQANFRVPVRKKVAATPAK
ncbi:hypothetical protein [Zavarzinella formosa]|uniref:hypothetical protein n=1 Tax=Zavarzinella formosa TaxID=360055 RepID=UPI0002D792CA|nr:hypothetical protein [Zavarzinella formosa]